MNSSTSIILQSHQLLTKRPAVCVCSCTNIWHLICTLQSLHLLGWKNTKQKQTHMHTAPYTNNKCATRGSNSLHSSAHLFNSLIERTSNHCDLKLNKNKTRPLKFRDFKNTLIRASELYECSVLLIMGYDFYHFLFSLSVMILESKKFLNLMPSKTTVVGHTRQQPHQTYIDRWLLNNHSE